MNVDFWAKKKAAVPVGGGFLGSRIAKQLAGAGATVFVPRTADGIDFRRKEDYDVFLRKQNWISS